MEGFGLSETLVFFGEPAEKVVGSKPVHAAKGYYDGDDAFISYHPHFTNTAIRDTQCDCYWSAVFTFETTEPENWIEKADPDDAHLAPRRAAPCDRRALPDVHDDQIHQGGDVPAYRHLDLNEFVLVGGDATSDNLPPRFSQIQYAWRSPTLGI